MKLAFLLFLIVAVPTVFAALSLGSWRLAWRYTRQFWFGLLIMFVIGCVVGLFMAGPSLAL